MMHAIEVFRQRRIGSIVGGKWRVECVLGSGGSADVYAASHVRNGRRVAVKILQAEAALEHAVVRRFAREGWLANEVAHDGVVRVFDDGVADDGCPYLVMDLVDGESLENRRRARRGRLCFEEALSVARSVLDILGAAHARGITHCDVKPANVLLDRNGRVRLSDFGIAFADELGASGHFGIGTPSFMAPEQLTAMAPLGPAVDVWAVGVMIYKLLTGRYPFQGVTIGGLVAAQRNGATPLADVVVGFSASASRVVDRALSFSPRARFANATEMARALRQSHEDALAETVVRREHPVRIANAASRA